MAPICELASTPAVARKSSAMPTAARLRETRRVASSRRWILRRSLSREVLRTLAACTEGALSSHLFAARPNCRFDEACADSDIEEFDRLLETHGHEIAAVILEPIVQGAGGMWFYSPDYLRRVRRSCDQAGVLLIADEIATGFGRTGRLFACEHASVSPDILCVGKALTGGTLTLAATIASGTVSDTIGEGDPGVFMHGPTFMGNALACAAANASLDLLDEGNWIGQVAAIGDQLVVELEACRALPAVADVRVLGAIGVVELHRPVDMAVVQPAFVEQGVWIRPFGKLVYTMPPYITSPDDVTRIADAIRTVVGSLS